MASTSERELDSEQVVRVMRWFLVELRAIRRSGF